MIILKNVSKVYIKNKKKIEVLKDINYTFKDGKLYCILGKSGAGKTTLIQILGLLLKSDGEIIFDNIDIKTLNESALANLRNNKIGFIFQSYFLNPLLTTLENVMLPIYANKTNNNDLKKEYAIELLNKLDLSNRLNHFPRELSGGEEQRVAIARALINNPSVILADEPTGSLDPENETNIMQILKDLSKKGKCVIVVSHSKEVLKYADVVLSLDNHSLKEVSK